MSRRPTPTITQEQLDAELSALLAPALAADKPRPGERSISGWAAFWSCDVSTARRRIFRLTGQGYMRSRLLRVLGPGGGRLYPSAHYGFTSKATAHLRQKPRAK